MRYLESVAVTTFAVLVVAIAPGAHAQDASERPRVPTGVVSGTVLRDGKPAAGVGVLVGPDEMSSPSSDRKPVARAVSGADGAYRLEGIPAGAYTVMVDAPGYIVKGALSWRRNGRSVSLADGETVSGFDLQLELGGAVTGRVTNEAGRPVVGQQITIKQIEADGTTKGVNAHVVNHGTDDRGIYRAYGLPPGRYVVGAGIPDDPRQLSIGHGRRYRLTYHRAATDERQAEPVTVTAGAESSGVDIVLPKSEPYRQATGTFVYADTGQPAAGVPVVYGPVSEDGLSGAYMAIGASGEAGEWRITGLKPGRWVVRAVPRGESPYFCRPVEIRVADSDLEGIVVGLERGGTVAGRVELEQGSSSSIKLDSMRVSLSYSDNTGALSRAIDPQPPGAHVEADGSFALTGVPPGTFELGIGPWDLVPKPIVVGVERAGAPLDGRVTIRDQESVADVRLRVAVGSGAIRGTAKVTNGPEAARGFGVLRRVSPDTYVTRQMVDGRGQFVISNLPAGDYSLTLVYYDVTGTTTREVKGEQKRVTVADGQTSEVTLEVDFAPKEGTRE